MSIADLRREYCLTGLRRSDLDANPIEQFKKWFAVAVAAHEAAGFSIDTNSATLATSDKHGHPSARIVLIKGVDSRGFTFYTNYESRKGQELAENPHAALVVYWPEQERQICIAGDVERLSREESETYFRTRPKGSRLAAWASRQSHVVRDRAELDRLWREIEAKHPGEEVPMPPFWGGYVLRPARVEFWQGRPNRLHDRFRYSMQPDGAWLIERLSP